MRHMVNAHTYDVTTNGHPRHLVTFAELQQHERAQFDYLEESEYHTPRFVQYRGEWHDTGDVMRATDDIRALGYDGFNADTMWSGIGFRYFDTDGNAYDYGESVVVATIIISD